MAVFNQFSNILPDPNFPIGEAGDQTASGLPGPGFKAVNFKSVESTQTSRTNSGRGISADQGLQYWEFGISYNPLLRDQFDPVDTFLLERGKRKVFYVALPQYSRPKSPAFAVSVANQELTVYGEDFEGSIESGRSSLYMTGSGSFTGTNTPKPGDMFSLEDSEDFNHQKVYKVTRVETSVTYQAGTVRPATNEVRVHFFPPLQRTTTQGSIINFNPKFRVRRTSDVHEHSIDEDGRISFSLQCEEIQA